MFLNYDFEPCGGGHHGAEEPYGSRDRCQLRQVDIAVSQGPKVAEAIRSVAVTEVTYYRGRSEYGGLKSDKVKRPRSLKIKTPRLRPAISDLNPEKLILKEAAWGNF